MAGQGQQILPEAPQLWAAIMRQDVNGAKKELWKRTPLTRPNLLYCEDPGDNNFNGLEKAIKIGNPRMVEMLLRDGNPDINRGGRSARTLLLLASGFNKKIIVHLLLAKGANIDQPMSDGTTPLVNAAKWGHIDVLRVLVARGANRQLSDTSGKTALAYAQAKGNRPVIALLQIAESDLLQVQFWYAAQESDINTIEHIMRTNTRERVARIVEVADPSDFGKTALHKAVVKGSVPLAIQIVKAGADVNRLSGSGFSALFLACGWGHVELVKLLIRRGARVDIPSPFTPLHNAAQWGKTTCVEVLLLNNANFRVRDQNGKTALDYAREKGKSDCVRLLEEADRARGAPRAGVAEKGQAAAQAASRKTATSTIASRRDGAAQARQRMLALAKERADKQRNDLDQMKQAMEADAQRVRDQAARRLAQHEQRATPQMSAEDLTRKVREDLNATAQRLIARRREMELASAEEARKRAALREIRKGAQQRRTDAYSDRRATEDSQGEDEEWAYSEDEAEDDQAFGGSFSGSFSAFGGGTIGGSFSDGFGGASFGGAGFGGSFGGGNFGGGFGSAAL